MASSEEETYSTLFASLKHPIRRRILRLLSTSPQSFSELLKVFRIESSHLTYHLEGSGDLLLKTEDGKYALSSLGEAAVSMMTQVEESPKVASRLPFPSRNWKLLVAGLTLGLILLSASFFIMYQSSSQLFNQYLNLEERSGLLEQVLREVLHLGNASLTCEYTANDTVATSLTKEVTYTNSTYQGISSPWGRPAQSYWVYNLLNDSTLELGVSILNPNQHHPYLSALILYQYPSTSDSKNESRDTPFLVISLKSFYSSETESEAYYKIFGTSITGNTTLSVALPSIGCYVIWIESPIEQNPTENYEIEYAITLRTQSQGKYSPFFLLNQSEETMIRLFFNYPHGNLPLQDP
jgi:DNA-binding transcriptional ArsR family regulator